MKSEETLIWTEILKYMHMISKIWCDLCVLIMFSQTQEEHETDVNLLNVLPSEIHGKFKLF